MRPISIKKEVYFTRGLHTRKVMQDSPPPEPSPVPEGRVPRISRLMALAIRFDRLIKEGEITDQADLARLSNVGLSTISSIEAGHDGVTLASLLKVLSALDLLKQTDEIFCLEKDPAFIEYGREHLSKSARGRR